MSKTLQCFIDLISYKDPEFILQAMKRKEFSQLTILHKVYAIFLGSLPILLLGIFTSSIIILCITLIIQTLTQTGYIINDIGNIKFLKIIMVFWALFFILISLPILSTVYLFHILTSLWNIKKGCRFLFGFEHIYVFHNSDIVFDDDIHKLFKASPYLSNAIKCIKKTDDKVTLYLEYFSNTILKNTVFAELNKEKDSTVTLKFTPDNHYSSRMLNFYDNGRNYNIYKEIEKLIETH